MTEEFFPTHEAPDFKPRTYRPHILKLLFPFIWSLMMLVPIIMISVTVNSLGFGSDPNVTASGWLFGGLYIIFVLSYFTMQVLFWYFDAWILTKTSLIDIELISLFNRRVAQLNWSQVQDVSVSTQGALATFFDYGDVIVQTAGKEGVFQLRSIPHARAVADIINELSEAAQRTKPAGGHLINPTHRLGEILVEQGVITESELIDVLDSQRQTGKRLGQVLVQRNLISNEDLVKALGSQYHIPYIDLSRYDIDPNVIPLMPYETAVKYHAVPIHRSADDVLNIAISQPSSQKFAELMEQFDMPLTFLVADEHYIQEAITGYYLDQERSDHSDLTPPPSFTGDNSVIE